MQRKHIDSTQWNVQSQHVDSHQWNVQSQHVDSHQWNVQSQHVDSHQWNVQRQHVGTVRASPAMWDLYGPFMSFNLGPIKVKLWDPNGFCK